jgi:hypothetical protein
MNANDYIVRIWPSGRITMGIAIYNRTGDALMFKALESYEAEGGVYAGDVYGCISTNKYKHRLATIGEIEVFEKFNSLDNVTEEFRVLQLEKLSGNSST